MFVFSLPGKELITKTNRLEIRLISSVTTDAGCCSIEHLGSTRLEPLLIGPAPGLIDLAGMYQP
jgi:hypothetical protein